MIGEEFDNLGVDYETLEDIELFGQIEEQRSAKIKSLERFATKWQRQKLKKNSGMDGKRFTAKVGEPVTKEVEFDNFRKDEETYDKPEHEHINKEEPAEEKEEFEEVHSKVREPGPEGVEFDICWKDEETGDESEHINKVEQAEAESKFKITEEDPKTANHQKKLRQKIQLKRMKNMKRVNSSWQEDRKIRMKEANKMSDKESKNVTSMRGTNRSRI